MSETLTPGTDPARIDPALIAPALIAPARIAPARTAPSQIAPAIPSRRITWFTIVGLLLVPVTIGGLLLAGLWNPTASLDTVTVERPSGTRSIDTSVTPGSPDSSLVTAPTQCPHVIPVTV